MYPFRIALILLFAGTFVQAQNLVPNSSFETNTGVPNGYGQYIRAVNWNNVNGWPSFQWPYASPDYLHTGGSGGAQLPNSTFGTVTPQNGNAVMAAVSWYGSTSNFREYFACQLTSPMTIGQTYDIVLNVTNGTNPLNGWSCNGVQAAFSVSPLNQTNHEPINVTPQISVTGNWYSATWQTLTFSFTPTQAYQHMTIGNFQNDANTTRSPVAGGSGAYYFYDGIAVQPAVVLDDGTLKLHGAVQGTTNLLDWTLDGPAADIEIFRSKDGEVFQMLDKVDQNGPVSYVDETPLYGTNWYKARKHNFDGSVTWSNLIELKNEGKSPLQLASVYPNPAVSELFVQVEHPPVEEIEAALYDMTGRMVLEKMVPASGLRLSSFEMQVSGLAAGVYTLRLRAGTHSISKPVMIGK